MALKYITKQLVNVSNIQMLQTRKVAKISSEFSAVRKYIMSKAEF